MIIVLQAGTTVGNLIRVLPPYSFDLCSSYIRFTVAMISRITLSLKRSAYMHSHGLVTDDDLAYPYELGGWRATKQDYGYRHGYSLEPTQRVRTQQQRSLTACHHISVIPSSDYLSDTASIYSSNTGSSHIVHNHVRHQDNLPSYVNFDDVDVQGRSRALGTESEGTGVLNISPAHTHDAAMGVGGGGAYRVASWPSNLDGAAVISDPSMLSANSAYELRVMRPAHVTRR